MVVDTAFELFTTLLAWLIYDTFWEILVGTGLLHLAFLSILISSVVDAGPKGETDEGGTTAYKSVTLGMGIAMVVLFVAGQPMINLPPASVQFAKPCTEADTVTAADSGTTFDGEFAGYVQTVTTPIWWGMVLRISYGLNNVAKAAVPCPPDLRLAMSSFAVAKLDDPDLTRDVVRFGRECFLPARAAYARTGKTPAIEEVLEEHGATDTEWMGSRVYTEIGGFYNEMYAHSPVNGWPFDPSARGTDRYEADNAARLGISPPEFGTPSCQEWWVTGLWPKLRSIAQTPELEATLDDPITFVQQNQIIRTLVAKEALYEPGADPGDDPEFSLAYLGRKFDVITATVGLALKQPVQQVEFTVIREAVPMVKAILLMVIVLTLPFLYILGNFSLTTLATATVGFITVNFAAFFWHLAWVIDNHLIAAFFPDVGHMLWSNIGFGADDVKNKVMNFLMPVLYVFMPVAYLSIVGWAGYHVVTGPTLTSAASGIGKGSTGAAQSAQRWGTAKAKEAGSATASAAGSVGRAASGVARGKVTPY